MTSAVLSPLSYSAALELANSGLWQKRLLPVGSIRYQGRRIDFDRDYLTGLVNAFKARSHNQVPLQLAGDDNRHNNNLANFGGDVLDAEVRPDGLWITVKPTERGAAILKENPRCGVSARIVEDYERRMTADISRPRFSTSSPLWTPA